MKMHRNNLNTFLKSKGYNLEQSEVSKYFGDFFQLFSSPTIKIRLSSSKSSEMLDVSSVGEPNNWFDVALVKALIERESELNKTAEIFSLITFLVQKLETVEALFDSNSYNSTKKKLEELEHKRVFQMFPNLKQEY
ncbi:hypothetical protein [Algoriphagus sp. A40]|uniref:hypothetical protein n=1 Tax=Algoriphagus sp. A40 TaxID=1945863 RepID=UPI00098543EB|nr:hypothetical protein [Algoriphagus sp. A40]OOG74851.1 hypothetical protein B0E43_10730 [Algoriphagus sp. A40]